MKTASSVLVSAILTVLLTLTACQTGTSDEQTEISAPENDTDGEEAFAANESDFHSDTTDVSEVIEETYVSESFRETETAEEVISELLPPDLPDNVNTNITSPEAAEILRKISEITDDYADAAVYFTDVEEEYYFGIRENEEYHSASTIKAPYCQYLIASEKDLTAPILFESADRTSASGKLEADSVGQSFTVRELIEYTIRYSDNQAYYLLHSTYGAEEYNSYVTSIGASGLSLDNGSEWAYITAKELSLAMSEIYKTSAENDILAEYLKQTTYNTQISAGTEYETAHKYGYNGGTDGYHDTAVVYAPERAYVLTVMTHIDYYAEDDPNALFRDTAKLCDELHEILFLNEK